MLRDPNSRVGPLTVAEFNPLTIFATLPYGMSSCDILKRGAHDNEMCSLGRATDVHAGHLQGEVKLDFKQP